VRNERFAERLISPIYTAQLERRWAAVREAMDERGIDILVMQRSNEFSRRLCEMVHRHAPSYHSTDTHTWLCDNFLIGENGTRRLHGFPQRSWSSGESFRALLSDSSPVVSTPSFEGTGF